MVKDAIKEIFPPDVPPVTRWRLAMFLAMVGFLFHVLWACSLLPGFSGFALAADFEQMNKDVTQIRLQLLTNQIFETRIRQCQAITTDNYDARRFWTEKLIELQRQHILLTGQTYPMPACGEL